jgi:hypothetical protein
MREVFCFQFYLFNGRCFVVTKHSLNGVNTFFLKLSCHSKVFVIASFIIFYLFIYFIKLINECALISTVGDLSYGKIYRSNTGEGEKSSISIVGAQVEYVRGAPCAVLLNTPPLFHSVYNAFFFFFGFLFFFFCYYIYVYYLLI